MSLTREYRKIGTVITRFRGTFIALEAWKVFDACFAVEVFARTVTVSTHQDGSVTFISEGKTYATVSRVLFASSIAGKTDRF